MATKEKTTLREFINSLERLSENGKYDNICVALQDNDNLCYDIGYYGIKEVFLQDELNEDNPVRGEKCLVIQM